MAAARLAASTAPGARRWVRLGGARRAATAAGAGGERAAASLTGPTSAYVHLPFCKRKCFYCDFPVEAVGLEGAEKPRAQPEAAARRPGACARRLGTRDRMAAYVDLVVREIRATAPLGGAPLETVSFGGGTPSLVPPALLEELLGALRAQFGIAPGAEVSLEADPGTFDAAQLAAYRALGVTRLSIGVQSFQQDLLAACGRSHSLADVRAAVEAVRGAGLPSWSLDLISGLPGLDLAGWRHSLEQAIAAGPDHVSVYDLQVEEGTPFDRWYGSGGRGRGRGRGGGGGALPEEPEAAAMFELASSLLTAAGYEHYEISNYARPGHRSRHNQVYWACRPYHAFGLGAASYTGGRRLSRPRGMAAYAAWVEAFAARGGGCPAAHLPAESVEERLLDHVMLSLRLSDGLDLCALQREHGAAVVRALLPAAERAMAAGLMRLAPPAPGAPLPPAAAAAAAAGPGAACAWLRGALSVGEACGVRLSDPAGFMLSNAVISDLFAALDPSA
ncbi:hemW [Scenedesmus sp. PABB004]|nr:hemW [Scenedesmus sp. PABB004]